jgi:phosphatidylglycerophosphatase A
MAQTVAFALFRYFDAAKPGPVGWVDGLAHGLEPGRRYVWAWAGLGILADDLVAAACTLLLMAWGRFAGWW